VFTATIVNECTGDNGEYSICISDGYSERTVGYVVPFDVGKEPEFDTGNIKKWIHHPGATRLLPGDIFTESKEIVGSHFVKRLAKNTTAKYASWMRSNERMLGALAGLNGSLPPFLKEPVAYLLTTEWNAVVALLREKGTEETVFAKLLVLSKRISLYGIAIDFSISAALLEELLAEQLRSLVNELDIRACDRIGSLLNIVDKFTVPVPKHTLEDTFYPVLCGPVQKLYDVLINRDGVTADQITFLSRLLSFARRMNFNIDRFPL
jgi:hypothetical protein